jgi:hypothetical protein
LESSTIDLPLHGGHAPSYLIRRMVRLAYAISKVIVDENGQQEFLRRLSDPLWFQAFGCVLGFDWHSSGVTTVVTGILKQALNEDVHSSIRALSLIGEIIFGAKASWQDPVKYNFAHGGKDGVPYPIARKIYDKSISYLTSAIEGAEIEREERIQALKKLGDLSVRMFNRDSTKDTI